MKKTITFLLILTSAIFLYLPIIVYCGGSPLYRPSPEIILWGGGKLIYGIFDHTYWWSCSLSYSPSLWEYGIASIGITIVIGHILFALVNSAVSLSKSALLTRAYLTTITIQTLATCITGAILFVFMRLIIKSNLYYLNIGKILFSLIGVSLFFASLLLWRFRNARISLRLWQKLFFHFEVFFAIVALVYVTSLAIIYVKNDFKLSRPYVSPPYYNECQNC